MLRYVSVVDNHYRPLLEVLGAAGPPGGLEHSVEVILGDRTVLVITDGPQAEDASVCFGHGPGHYRRAVKALSQAPPDGGAAPPRLWSTPPDVRDQIKGCACDQRYPLVGSRYHEAGMPLDRLIAELDRLVTRLDEQGRTINEAVVRRARILLGHLRV